MDENNADNVKPVLVDSYQLDSKIKEYKFETRDLTLTGETQLPSPGLMQTTLPTLLEEQGPETLISLTRKTWFDDLWEEELLRSTLSVKINQLNVEILLREALHKNPLNTNLYIQLQNYYQQREEPLLEAMACISVPNNESKCTNIFYKIANMPTAPEREENFGVAAEEYREKDQQAQTLLAQNDATQAELVLRSLLKKYPLDESLIQLLGEIYLKTEEWGMALMLFTFAHKQWPESDEIAKKYVGALVATGQESLALKTVQNALANNKNKNLLHYYAQLLSKAEQHVAAEKIYRQLTSLKPNDHKSWLGLAGECEKQQKHLKSQRAYIQAMRIAPEDKHSYEGLARLATLDGEAEEAKAWRRKAALVTKETEPTIIAEKTPPRFGRTTDQPQSTFKPLDPDDRYSDEVWQAIKIADQEFTSGDWNKTLLHVLYALRHDPKNPKILEKAARLYMLRKEWDKAEKFWSHLNETKQSTPLQQEQLAKSLLFQGKILPAQEILKSKQSLSARYYLACCQIVTKGKNETATALGSLGILATGHLAYRLTTEKDVLNKIMNNEQYLNLVSRITECDIDEPEHVGEVLKNIFQHSTAMMNALRRGQAKIAHKHLAQLRRLGVKKPQLDFYEAYINGLTGEKKTAATNLRQLANMSTDAEQRRLTGLLLFDLEAFELAIDLLEQSAATIKEQSILFSAYAQTGRDQKALALLQKLSKETPQVLGTYIPKYSPAWNALKNSPAVSNKTQNIWDKKWPQNTTEPNELFSVINDHLSGSDEKGALELLNKAMKDTVLNSNPEVLMLKANILIKMNQLEAAEKIYEEILNEHPGDIRAMMQLADIYETQEKLELARELYTLCDERSQRPQIQFKYFLSLLKTGDKQTAEALLASIEQTEQNPVYHYIHAVKAFMNYQPEVALYYIRAAQNVYYPLDNYYFLSTLFQENWIQPTEVGLIAE